MTITEYAVRRTSGDETTIVPVGDEVLMRQTVAEFLQQGEQAEPVVRQVPDWTVDPTALTQVRREVYREHVLAVADRVWAEETSVADGLAEIRDFLPRELADRVTADGLGEVLHALTYQQRVEDDEIPPDPDQDKRALEEIAEKLVAEAADALIGGDR